MSEVLYLDVRSTVVWLSGTKVEVPDSTLGVPTNLVVIACSHLSSSVLYLSETLASKGLTVSKGLFSVVLSPSENPIVEAILVPYLSSFR